MNLPLWFSPAIMKMVVMRYAVRIISKQTACAVEAPLLGAVTTPNGVGTMTETMYELNMQPNICPMKRQKQRIAGMAPVNNMASVTCGEESVTHGQSFNVRCHTAGLKRPPETRKKMKTLTINDRPNAVAM